MKVSKIEELFGTLQQSIVAEWRNHLKTSKYSKHMALDEFYKEMPELVDSLIEDYMGHNKDKVEDYVNVLKAEDLDALEYLEELHEVCESGRKLLDGVTELESDLDDILGLIDSVMYKVRELKEGIMDLKDFLNESLNEGFGSFPSKRDWLSALKEFSDELSLTIPVVKGNKFNPAWLKKATSNGWEYEGDNSSRTLWARIIAATDVKKIEDVLDWLEDNWDSIQYELADSDDAFSNCMDIFPTFG